MEENKTKVLRVFLLTIQSHLFSFTLRFLFLQPQATSYSFYSAFMYTVKEKGAKPDRKQQTLSYGLRNLHSTEASCLRILQILPRNLKEIARL